MSEFISHSYCAVVFCEAYTWDAAADEIFLVVFISPMKKSEGLLLIESQHTCLPLPLHHKASCLLRPPNIVSCMFVPPVT